MAKLNTSSNRLFALTQNMARLPSTVGAQLLRDGKDFAQGRTTRSDGTPVPGLRDFLYPAGMALDHTTLAIGTAMLEPLTRSGVQAQGKELAKAARLFETRGWVENPRSFHVTPPAAQPTRLQRKPVGQNREELTFQFSSAYQPKAGIPGTDRWRSYNQGTVNVRALQYTDRPRPWVVVLHGVGMGTPHDLKLLGAERLHRELGLNVITLPFPLSGPRSVKGQLPLGPDLLNMLNAQAQGLSDTRQLIAWIRKTQPGQPIGAMGLSMGGFGIGLLAGFERLGTAVSVIPGYDYVNLMAKPVSEVLPETSRAQFVADASRVLRPMNIDAFPSLTDPKFSHVLGAKADALTLAESTVLMAKHLGVEPQWTSGGHLTGAIANASAVEDLFKDFGRAG